ncbi:hypothetical protein RFEPED_0781 [Rickettsia felis str. Pedreira]|uniref:Uncharacterized protein n=1 Tax=Rickettsia felis str. Pedreira TaxID=1359196 RepID=A0A0F3MRN1_RICFI|nr:hypothetical protein RFEPED_0781 [Rickettsia felis str. Pedreira]
MREELHSNLTKQSSKKFCKSEFFYYFSWIAVLPTVARNDD